jgi:hypothetical protein
MEISKKMYGIRLPPIHHYKLPSTLLINEKEKFFNKKIKNLPDELKRYIFDFLKLEFIYNDFIERIQSKPCKNLDYLALTPILPYIFAFPSLTKLCMEKINYFQKTYFFIKVNGNKSYLQYKKGNDFALTLLIYLYK